MQCKFYNYKHYFTPYKFFLAVLTGVFHLSPSDNKSLQNYSKYPSLTVLQSRWSQFFSLSSKRILCISSSWTDSGLFIYHLSASNFNLLHNSQRINFSYPVMPTFAFLVCWFVAFTYVINCFICYHITYVCYFVVIY